IYSTSYRTNAERNKSAWLDRRRRVPSICTNRRTHVTRLCTQVFGLGPGVSSTSFGLITLLWISTGLISGEAGQGRAFISITQGA
ncbi:hypothetical protein Micbo1qcDRAFT_170107, partial [Microdochium bolleyi]